MPTQSEATERDLITEVETLLAGVPEKLYDIPHPEYAGASHRISDKPGAHWANFGHIATVVPSCAQLFAKSPELLRRLVEEVKRDRDALKMMVQLWDDNNPDDPCGCVGASDDCRYPPTCELCVARMLMEGRDPNA